MSEIRSGYKQIEVGVIPDDWEVQRMGDISEITKLAGFEYTRYFNSYKNGGEIIVIRGTNITNNKLDLEEIKTIPTTTSEKLPRSKLKKGDLVFAYVGTIGPVYLIESNGKYHLGPNTARITSNEKLLPQFAYCYFTSDLAKGEMILHTSIGAQPSLSMSKIRRFRIPLPPTLAEQTAIAAVLSDTDALIRKLDQLITKKRNIKQGAMQELLTGKRRLPGFSGAWEEKKLGSFSTTFAGGTPPTSVSTYYGGDIPWITSSDLNKCEIFDVPGRITVEGFNNSSAKMIDSETLLIAMYGATAGVSAISKIKAAINQAVLAVVPEENSMRYIFYFFQLWKQRLIQVYTQGGQPNFSAEIIKSFFVPLPPTLAEQTAIATVLSDMDDEIAVLEQKRDKYRTVKQGMMQVLLTGKVRLV